MFKKIDVMLHLCVYECNIDVNKMKNNSVTIIYVKGFNVNEISLHQIIVHRFEYMMAFDSWILLFRLHLSFSRITSIFVLVLVTL